MHLIIDKRYNAKPHSELRRQAIKYTIALITTPWCPAFLVNNVGHACPHSWLTLFQIQTSSGINCGKKLEENYPAG